MTRLPLFFALALLLPASGGTISWTPTIATVGTEICTQPLSPTTWATGNGNQNIHVCWGNISGGASWSAPNQALQRTFLNGFSGTPNWHLLDQYGAGLTNQIQITEEVTGTLTSGAYSGVTCASGTTFTAACPGFTSDPKGIYLVLPADGSVTITGGGAGCHASGFNNVGVGILATQPSYAGYPSPNSNHGLDNQIEVESHEIFESESSTGGYYYECPNSIPNETADACQNSFPFPSGSGATAYNLAIGSSHYFVTSLWQKSPYNACLLTPPNLNGYYGAPCTQVSDCAAPSGYQLNCVAHQCVLPTCGDLVKDGTETDTDCGGTCIAPQNTSPNLSARTCANGKACLNNTDCGSNFCSSLVCTACTTGGQCLSGTCTAGACQ